MSQEEISRWLGVSRSVVANIESRRTSRSRAFSRALQATGLMTDAFYSGFLEAVPGSDAARRLGMKGPTRKQMGANAKRMLETIFEHPIEPDRLKELDDCLQRLVASLPTTPVSVPTMKRIKGVDVSTLYNPGDCPFRDDEEVMLTIVANAAPRSIFELRDEAFTEQAFASGEDGKVIPLGVGSAEFIASVS